MMNRALWWCVGSVLFAACGAGAGAELTEKSLLGTWTTSNPVSGTLTYAFTAQRFTLLSSSDSSGGTKDQEGTWTLSNATLTTTVDTISFHPSDGGTVVNGAIQEVSDAGAACVLIPHGTFSATSCTVQVESSQASLPSPDRLTLTESSTGVAPTYERQK